MIEDLSSLRSFLYVPCDKPGMLEKSLSLDCDALILDLEDAVSIEYKDEARKNLLGFKESLGDSPKPAFVRVNSVDSPIFPKDIQAVLETAVQGIVLPMADVEAVKEADSELSRMGPPDREIWIVPLIETARGLETISEVLEASDRVAAAQFGAEDFTDDLGIPRTEEGDEISFARHRFVLACRAKGLAAIDTPFTNFRNTKGLRRDSGLARNMGMTGKTCIHPDQIDVINKTFQPSESERLEAESILKAWEERTDEAGGTAVYNGKMLDRPIVNRARRVVELAERYSQSITKM